MWLAMCLWHLPVYGVLATTGAIVSQNSSPYLEAIFLTFANVSMAGVLGIFELIWLGLIAAAQKDDLWSNDAVVKEIAGYSASTALTAYLQIETINKVRMWYYAKDYTWDDLKESACTENDVDCDEEESSDVAT